MLIYACIIHMYLNSFFFLRFFKEIYGITVNNDVFAYFKGKKKTELVLKCHLEHCHLSCAVNLT